MFFSGGLIPSYLLVAKTLDLNDTIWSIVLPTAINTWNLIIMRTYFCSIPPSMEESAKLDGANDFVVLFRIILPLSLPVVSVIILFYAVEHWNSYFNEMIFLQTREKYPLQIILREILITNDNKAIQGITSDRETIAENVKYALVVVSSAPILCLYPFLQKHFVKGIMIVGQIESSRNKQS